MNTKKILVTNGRYPITLDLIRNLAHGKHEIYLAETQWINLSRFSNAVKKSFIVPSPRFNPKEHISKLLEIVTKEKIDLFIPMWEDIFIVSKYAHEFPKSCKLFCSDFQLLDRIHNKWSFYSLMEEIGIKAPKTSLITSKKDLENIIIDSYALKACYSRASQHVHRITNNQQIPDISPTETHPWMAQEWLDGDNYCSYSICNNGKVHAHVTYPVDFVIKNKTSLVKNVGSYCISFRVSQHDAILKWVENFAKATNFTGQVGFDFIELDNKEIYAIECNPRITGGVSLFTPNNRIDNAFFAKNSEIIQPPIDERTQITMGNLLYGWRQAASCNKLDIFFSNLFYAKDITFSFKDIKPFLAQPLIFAKYISDGIRFKKPLPAAFTHDLDYNG